MSSKHWGSFSRTALSVAVAIVAAAPAMAQNTTAAISGRVSLADGKPVAGATVSIVHRESGSVNNLVTDAEGRYSTRGLRVGGPYTVTVTKGSDKDVRDDVYLQLAENLSLDVRLGGNVLESVVVTGTANKQFNSGSMGAGTSIGRAQLEGLASIQRSLQDYARTDPRLAQTDKERGEISALGQNSRFNAVTVDGVRTNDTFGLESNNLPTAKQPISIDAIQSVQVNISNYDVTQQGYTGANINAITKSGTNEFHGSVYYVYRDDQLSGDKFNRTATTYYAPAKFKEDTKGFTLGGPILKDKLFFFGSYEELKSSKDGPTYGTIGSQLTNVGITDAQVAAAIAAGKTLGLDIGTLNAPSGTELVVKDALLKFDWNISDNHRANIRFARTEQSEPMFPNNASNALSLSSHWYSQNKTLDTVVGQWFADWTPNFSTELKVSNRKYDSVPLNNSNLPQIALVFTDLYNGSTSSRFLDFGTEMSRHTNVLRTKTLDTYFAGNLVIDDHELKVGFDYSKNDVFNAFLQNTKGNYTFNPTAASGSTPARTAIENWLAGVPTSYTLQVPLAGKTLDDGTAIWSLANLGLFAQDTWSVNDKLTLTAGVRVDRMLTNDRPLANATAKTAFGYDNSISVDGMNLVQPRFGFNYAFDAADKRKSQLRGGFGLFQGAAANVWLSNAYSNTGMAMRTITCSGTSGSSCANAGVKFSADPDNQPTIAGAQPAQAVDLISPSLKQPSTWKFNLAWDAELPWFGLVGGAEWIHTEIKDGIYYQHLNLGAPTATGSDGRNLYYDAAGRNPANWSGGTTNSGTINAKANRNTGFTNVLLADRSGKGGGDALTLSLSQQNRDWGWSAAYTRQSMTEVSPLTSSTSNSNFNSRSVFNPNEEVDANSAYLIKDRISASLNWSKAFFGTYKTRFGVFYEGRKGKPYSWTFGNDMNGDGVSGNDLMYIPTAPGSGEVIFYGATPEARAANEARFWAVVDANKELRDAKGGVVKRNGSFAPFVNSFDVRISQEIPGFSSKHKGVLSLDILNFGNLLNKRWGHIDEVGFFSAGGNRKTFVNYAGIQDGKYVYNTTAVTDYTTKQNKGESQWAMQITARYEF